MMLAIMSSTRAAHRLVGGMLIVLGVATILGIVLSLRAKTDSARRTTENLNARIRAW